MPAVKEKEARPQQEVSVPAPAPHIIQPLMPSRFEIEEALRARHVGTAHSGSRPEDVLDPAYWAHVGAKLHVRDRIELWADDGAWFLEAVVLSAGRNWARVHLLRVEHLTPQTQIELPAPGYQVVYRGMQDKWCVLREMDNQIVQKGEDSRDDAIVWLAGHIKVYQ